MRRKVGKIWEAEHSPGGTAGDNCQRLASLSGDYGIGTIGAEAAYGYFPSSSKQSINTNGITHTVDLRRERCVASPGLPSSHKQVGDCDVLLGRLNGPILIKHDGQVSNRSCLAGGTKRNKHATKHNASHGIAQRSPFDHRTLPFNIWLRVPVHNAHKTIVTYLQPFLHVQYSKFVYISWQKPLQRIDFSLSFLLKHLYYPKQ